MSYWPKRISSWAVIRNLFFVLFLLPWSPPLWGQDISENKLALYQAEQLYRSGSNLEEAIARYKKGFENRVNDASISLDALSAAAKARDSISTILFIEQGLLAGLKIQDYRKLWPRLGNGLDIESLLSKCDTITHRRQYLSTLNYTLIDTLEMLAVRDQAYRSGEDEDGLQRVNDSLNWRILKDITVRLNRLPKYSEIGMDGTDNLDLLFHHMDKDIIEWFLPYVHKNICSGESNLAETILYQLERIGMSEGTIYSITNDFQIKRIGHRTKMSNGYYCQSFGEWFKERSRQDNLFYVVPIDPNISIDEVNRVRALFQLDPIQSKWKREPWARVVSMEEFVIRITE